MHCRNCQAELAPHAAFCDECGASLETTCPSCSSPNRPGAKYCRHCGGAIGAGWSGARPPVRAASPRSYTPRHLAERILTTRSAMEGERKQVTVLFADLENFTGLGQALDPEALHELMDSVFTALLEVIHRYEGTVNQFTGDGVMALFGAPLALENHPLRAVQAALEIQQVMRQSADEFRSRWGHAPMLRIGLHTGRVVVGRIGDDLRMDYTAQGDIVNLAARLQQAAEPGTVAMSAVTHSLVAGAAEATSLGPRSLKGLPAPVEVFRPERLKRQGFGTGTAGPAPSSLAGREVELAVLVDLFEEVRATGRPRMVLVTGEAGVGKSRLLAELRRRLSPAGTYWLEGHCVPYGRNTPYQPIIEILRGVCDLHESDSEPAAIAKLRESLDWLREEGRRIEPALRYVLGLGPPDTEMMLLSPSERKAVLTLAIDRLLRWRARLGPHVVVIEGYQWVDSASDEYLTRAGGELTHGPILFALTCRPDPSGRTAVGPAGARIDLRPLLPSESRALVQRLTESSPLPEELVTLIVDRAGGNPLFIEEVTRTLREGGSAEVPPTVADVLAARIDRLPLAAKSILQVASVIGREFSRSQLERALDAEGDAGALETLTDLGLITEREDAPGEYAFRQGLLQEVAYDAMLLQRRRVLHRRVGEALEDLYRDRPFEHVDVLARHFFNAEEWERAVLYLREAGRKATALCANTEALQRFTRALEAVRRLPETLERTRVVLDIRLEQYGPLLQLGRLEEILGLAREAEELARVLGDERRLARVYTTLVNYHYLRGDPDVAIDFGQRCLAMPLGGSPGIERSARQYLAMSYHVLGRYGAAAEILAGNVAALEQKESELARPGPENLHYVTSCGWLAWARVETGDFSGAHAAAGEAVRVAEAAGNVYARAIAHSLSGLVALRQGDFDGALPQLETALALCHEHCLIVWEPIPSSLLGLVVVLRGDLERGLELLQVAGSRTEALGVNAYRSLWQAQLAMGLLVAGRVEAAVEVAREAVALAERFREAGNHARALLTLGEACRRSANPSLADEAIRQALVEAEQLGMRPLVAYCYLVLAGLARSRGDGLQQAEYLETASTQAQTLGMHLWPVAIRVATGTPRGHPA